MTQAPLRRPARAGGHLAIAGAGAAAAFLLLAATVILRPIAPGQFLVLAFLAGIVGIAAIAARVAPAWLISIGILFVPMAGNWELVGVPGTIAPDRVLLLAGVIATLARVPAVRDLPDPKFRAAHWLFAVYLAYALGSALVVGTLFSDSVFQLERMGITALGCFLVAPVAFARPEDRRILLWCLAGMGAYLGVLAVFEIAAPGLVVPHFITDPSIARHLGRARGPFLEAELNGFAMFVALVAALVLYANSKIPRERALALLVVAPCALGILLTLTRTTWLGAVLGVLVAMLVSRQLRPYLLPAIAAGVLLVIGAFAVIPGLQASASDRANNQGTVYERQNLNRAALNMMLDLPLTGHGWNRFASVADEFFWQADDYPLGVTKAKVGAHNLLLGIGSELGLIGIFLWAAGLVAAGWAALTGPIPPELRAWRIGFVAIAVHYAIVVLFTPARHPYLLLTVLVWAAVAAGPNSLQPRQESRA